MLQLDAAEKEGGGEAKPLPGGDDAQKGPSLMIPNSASPLPGQFAWLQAEEDTTSTPASPLLDQPTTLRGEAARYLWRQRVISCGLSPRSLSSRKLASPKLGAKQNPPVEYIPRGQLVEEASMSNAPLPPPPPAGFVGTCLSSHPSRQPGALASSPDDPMQG